MSRRDAPWHDDDALSFSRIPLPSVPLPFLMRSPRQCLCRWLLACLLLSWGLAYGAPLMRPAGPMSTSVCSAARTLRLVDPGTNKSVERGDVGAHGLPDCAQCLASTLAAPPPAATAATAFSAPLPLTPAAQSRDIPTPALPAMPPARGPPLSI